MNMKIQDYDTSVHLVKLLHFLKDYTIESIF